MWTLTHPPVSNIIPSQVLHRQYQRSAYSNLSRIAKQISQIPRFVVRTAGSVTNLINFSNINTRWRLNDEAWTIGPWYINNNTLLFLLRPHFYTWVSRLPYADNDKPSDPAHRNLLLHLFKIKFTF